MDLVSIERERGGAVRLCRGRVDAHANKIELFGEVWQVECAVFYEVNPEHYVSYRRRRDSFVLCDSASSTPCVDARFPDTLVTDDLFLQGRVCVLLYLSLKRR